MSPETEIEPFQVNAKSAETTTVVLEEKYDSNIKSKSNCDSTFIADIIEREQNCNSSNSNNSGYSGKIEEDRIMYSKILFQDTLLMIAVWEALLLI